MLRPSYDNCELKEEHDKYEKICEEAFQEGKKIKSIKFADWLDSPWKGNSLIYEVLKLLQVGFNAPFDRSYMHDFSQSSHTSESIYVLIFSRFLHR